MVGSSAYALALLLRHTTKYGELIFTGILGLPFLAIAIVTYIRKKYRNKEN